LRGILAQYPQPAGTRPPNGRATIFRSLMPSFAHPTISRSFYLVFCTSPTIPRAQALFNTTLFFNTIEIIADIEFNIFLLSAGTKVAQTDLKIL
jgi:hypothetical protein